MNNYVYTNYLNWLFSMEHFPVIAQNAEFLFCGIDSNSLVL